MKKVLIINLILLVAASGEAQIATVGSPHFDVQGPLYVRQNYHTLNKASNGWVAWGIRDISTSEATISLSNINNAFFQGNVGIGTSSSLAKLHVANSSISLTSTNSSDANLIIQGTSSTRSTSEGAALGFVVPADTDGSNFWQQGRILVTPENTNNANASGRMYLQTRYHGNGAWNWRKNLVLNSSGSVGVGTENTGTHKLAVEGTIGAREIKVEATGWSDFVFENDYELRTLEEVEEHIAKKGHLPEIPNKAEVTENGINLGEMNAKLLQKIEELTLYLIEQNKEIQELQKEVSALKNE
ncbi:MAG: hypothetical protein ABJF04_04800 [Reichenbachiella sp.]|uniref:hypothetical protein n=1 Tax=Reichenbachiella sp. TaxID=2184521 RepID=UPI0032657490